MVTAYEYFRFILGGIKVANIVIFYQNSASTKKNMITRIACMKDISLICFSHTNFYNRPTISQLFQIAIVCDEMLLEFQYNGVI